VAYRFPPELAECTGFDWDAGNDTKNQKHGVSREESEQVFSNRPIVIAGAKTGATGELRRAALGQSDAGRRLTIVFTAEELSSV
jgi:hypothetical protein